MKNILLLFVSFLLISQTVSQNSVDLVGPFTKGAFGCLIQAGLGLVMIRAIDDSGALDPNALQTLQNAQAAGADADIYIVLCPSISVQNHIDTVNNAISSSLYSQFWIKITDNVSPGCEWTQYTQAENCAFIQEFTGLFNSNSQSIGVFSTYNLWTSYLGESCTVNSFLTSIWYGNYLSNGVLDSSLSFSDFVPFGGWGQPNRKVVLGSQHITLCGNPLWHAYLDLNWQ